MPVSGGLTSGVVGVGLVVGGGLVEGGVFFGGVVLLELEQPTAARPQTSERARSFFTAVNPFAYIHLFPPAAG